MRKLRDNSASSVEEAGLPSGRPAFFYLCSRATQKFSEYRLVEFISELSGWTLWNSARLQGNALPVRWEFSRREWGAPASSFLADLAGLIVVPSAVTRGELIFFTKRAARAVRGGLRDPRIFASVQHTSLRNAITLTGEVSIRLSLPMSVEKQFTQDNFIRATNHANRARVAAHVLAPKMQELFPNLFSKDTCLTPIGQQGWSNLTLSVDSEGGGHRYILRLAPCTSGCASRSTPALEKERYVLERLSGFDFVPTLPFNASGRLALSLSSKGELQYGYLLESCLPFEAPRNDCGPRDRLLILRQLGEICKKIHSVKVSGYGLDFDEERSGFRHETFVDFLSAKATGIEDSPIDSQMKRWLIARVESLSHLDPEPRLFHRDLLGNWGNFLVDDARRVRGIIDWEYAGSGPAFYYEIAALIYVLTRDGHSPQDIEHDLVAVLEGYGMTLEHFKAHYEREVETLVLLNSISALQRYEALKQSGDIKREPWRQLFAERASMICARSYRNR